MQTTGLEPVFLLPLANRAMYLPKGDKEIVNGSSIFPHATGPGNQDVVEVQEP
jgi:hypothetical protein